MLNGDNPNKRHSWLVWTLANAAGQALGGVFGCATLWCLVFGAMRASDSSFVFLFLAFAAFGAVLGMGVGAIQALVLGEEGVPGWRWTLASAVGGAIGWVIVFLLLRFIGSSFPKSGWD